MKKTLIFIGILCAVAFVFYNFVKNEQEVSRACFNNYCYNLEIAKTSGERERGLMFRDSLDEKSGMLFIFDQEGYYPFWMKNTLIPLDIIWLNERKEVVFLKENVQPCRVDSCPLINPSRPAKYVLELNAGEIKKIALKEDDILITVMK